jgi:hypothetical protein
MPLQVKCKTYLLHKSQESLEGAICSLYSIQKIHFVPFSWAQMTEAGTATNSFGRPGKWNGYCNPLERAGQTYSFFARHVGMREDICARFALHGRFLRPENVFP